MVRKVALVAGWVALALASSPASALELQDAQHVAMTVPDGWAVSADGAWSMADAPDHVARARIMSHSGGVLTDTAAEAYLVDLVAQTWGTYTIDRHVRRVTCGRFVGVEVYGHGAGDGWERARFHLLLLVDAQSMQRGVVVLLSGRADAWDAVHPVLDRAVHALH